ncbi:MAG: hypothetical protein KatS3mg108_1846 [Isosphaeraceae bacterium]|jgi:ligand-binding SRPBCC domain-containing protein|nr:MAG: hypothetical protein KatS3mg108_1846 [Isosphaeraceae bacterium]
MARFVKESRIAASPAEVFAFHESPGALLRLTPPGMRLEVFRDDGSLRVGSCVGVRIWVGPLKVDWLAEHTEYDPPHGFADRQVRGPFRSWYHRHRFLDDGAGGTLLRDEIDYELSGGLIGFLMQQMNVAAQLERAFADRHERTRRLVESGEWRTRPVTDSGGAAQSSPPSESSDGGSR